MNRADVEPIDVTPAQGGERLLSNGKVHEHLDRDPQRDSASGESGKVGTVWAVRPKILFIR